MKKTDLLDLADITKDTTSHNNKFIYSDSINNYINHLISLPNLTITEELICQLHTLLFQSKNPELAGKYRTGNARDIPDYFSFPEHSQIPHFMSHLINQMNTSASIYHPIEYAAICNKRIIDISPFTIGNYEVALLLTNIILAKSGYSMITIDNSNKSIYEKVLFESQTTNLFNIDDLILFFIQTVINSQK